jgi:5'-nucleotidase / UDP-sugar diphosphatase
MSKFLKIIIIMLIIFSILASSPANLNKNENSNKTLNILFTHDIHSYLQAVQVADVQGNIKEQGGLARIAELVNEQRDQFGENTLLLDAGDFSMGTLFHSIYPTEAAELRTLGRMGYDVITFGNHELDLNADRFAQMLDSAKSSGDPLPEIVASNFIFDPGNPRSDALQKAFNEYPVHDYLVIERNNLRIGIFGLMGKSAAIDTAYPKDISFADPIETAKLVTSKLKSDENVDVIIALSHSGTWKKKSDSEDEILAAQVPEIDVIISGHTHTILKEPIIIGKTIIVSAGCYGAYLGVLQVDFSDNEKGELISYDLIEVTDQIAADSEIENFIMDFKSSIEQNILSQQNFQFEQVLAESDFNFDTMTELFSQPGENGLGNLIADAYRYSIEKMEGEEHTNIQVAVEPLGMIRSSLVKGDITVSDAFQVLSLGISQDGQIGVPLVSFYLTGKDIMTMLELETTVAPLIDEDAYLNVSGISFSHNPFRIPFNRVMNVNLISDDGSEESIEKDTLYRVVSNYWAYEALESIHQQTYGIVKLTPRDKMGTPIHDPQDAILDTDLEMDGIQDIKEWEALSIFLKSFQDIDGDGIPNIPEYYKTPAGRNIVSASLSPTALLVNINHITLFILGFLILLLLFLFIIIKVIKKRIKMHQNQEE